MVAHVLQHVHLGQNSPSSSVCLCRKEAAAPNWITTLATVTLTQDSECLDIHAHTKNSLEPSQTNF